MEYSRAAPQLAIAVSTPPRLETPHFTATLPPPRLRSTLGRAARPAFTKFAARPKSKSPELVPSYLMGRPAQCYLVRRFLLGGLPAGAALSSTSRVAHISRGKLPGRLTKDSRQGMGQTRTPLPPRRLTR